MKTALILGLGLGCAAAGLPGDAAAGQPLEERLGQPLEKRLERARRLSADACATETTTFSTCLADASITFTPATPAGPWASCDAIDGDGYEDAAPAGECCTNGGYGNSFAENGYGCGTTLAEVQASGCCQAGFLLRYSLQPGREDQSYWDCVSFVDKAGCAAKGPHYIWSADGMGPGSCPHTVADAEALGSDSALGSGPLLATAVLATAAAAL